MTEGIRPFTVKIPEAELVDLRRRLELVRFPEPATTSGWVQGVPLPAMQRLRDHWLTAYDWRVCEERLNRNGSCCTRIDGLDFHFLHVRSHEPDAIPIILTHGWPGSIIEFLDVTGPLTNPGAHGGAAGDAFHVIVPSLPGYGFSGKPSETGWTTRRTANAWAQLMKRLGYDRFAAQGGDWGSSVTSWLANDFADRLIGIHFNLMAAGPSPDELNSLSPDETERLAAMARHSSTGRGYSEIQSTKPQTIGYLLADSPLGQAAWIFEKFHAWSDCGDDPIARFGADRLLDNISLYWFTNSASSSARLYWESLKTFSPEAPSDVPCGFSVFPKEMFRPTRTWAERRYTNLHHYNELDAGGHFAAYEVPDLFVRELRDSFRPLR